METKVWADLIGYIIIVLGGFTAACTFLYKFGLAVIKSNSDIRKEGIEAIVKVKTDADKKKLKIEIYEDINELKDSIKIIEDDVKRTNEKRADDMFKIFDKFR